MYLTIVLPFPQICKLYTINIYNDSLFTSFIGNHFTNTADTVKM